MVLEYFTLRRGKSQQVQSPVLKDEDEQFLQRIASEGPPESNKQLVILDNGEKVKGKDAQIALMDGADQIPLPTSPPPEEAQKAEAGYSKSKEEEKQKRTLMSFISQVNTGNLNVFKGKGKKQPSHDAKAGAEASTRAEGAETAADTVEEDEETKRERADLTRILDQLNLAAVNNRAFSFSKESQKLMEEFTQILKDMVNGVPTAYDDLEQLLRRYDAQLRKMFGDMPPFVQNLVKSLPAKVMTALGPELAAASSEKPGYDLKVKQQGQSSKDDKKSKKSKIPSVKKLVTTQGTVAGMLRSIVNFLEARFPAFISGTNIIMSLAVFLLLFVFWYCHKRGREVRLAKEAAAADAESDLEKSTATLDDSAVLEDPREDFSSTVVEPPDDRASAETETVLNQKEPAEVPLPVPEAEGALEIDTSKVEPKPA